jgi:DNA repair exonuclease SbcCD ATPase subunit
MALPAARFGDVGEYEARTPNLQLLERSAWGGRLSIPLDGWLRQALLCECSTRGALLDSQRAVERVCSARGSGRILKISLAGKREDNGMQRNKPFCLLVMAVAACGSLVSAAPRRASTSEQDPSQNESVAEAARKARDKKKAASKSAKVITDDDLDRSTFKPGQLNVVGAPAQPETEPPKEAPAANAEATDEAADKEAAKKAAEEDAQIARLKLQLTQAEKDLDLAQRELALDQDAFLSKPDYANDTAGKAKLDAERQQISDKQQEIEKLKTRLAALEELKSHRKASTRQAAPAAQSEQPATPPHL